MKSNKYTSFAQIDAELEILQLEKEIHLQKTILNLEKIKSSLQPSQIVHEALGSFKHFISNSYLKLLIKALPILVNWFIKRKRGQ